jgi:uncharacterized protein (UPF0248 family)
MTRGFVRDTLLRYKWSEKGLTSLKIRYVSRGSTGDMADLYGDEIVHIGKSFLELEEGTMIPYHRIMEVRSGENVVWSRELNH